MTKTYAHITSKRALLKEVARRVHGTHHKSQWGRAVVKYAALLVEEVTFKELDAAYREHRLESFLLDGARSWEQLGVSGGRFPFLTVDLARLFAAPSEITAFYRLGFTEVAGMIGRAMQQAYTHISDVLACSVRAHA